jgi:chloride channel protein, CIC family
VASHLESESIYTMKLSRRGTHLEHGRDVDVMQSVRVSEVMITDIASVPVSMKLSDLTRHFQTYKRHAFPVVDQDEDLYGVVSLQDLERSLQSEKNNNVTAGDIATRSLSTVYPDEPMGIALKRMGPRDLSSLPVVDRNDPHKLLGVIRRRNIVRAYNLGTVRRQEIQHKMAQMRHNHGVGARFVELKVAQDASALTASLAKLALPWNCVIVSIRRGDQVIIPHGNTILSLGDKVTAFVEAEDEKTLRKWFSPK